MSSESVQKQFDAAGVGESWGVLIAAGAVLAVLGLLAVVFPYVSGLSLSIGLGALLVVGGAVHVAHAFTSFGKGWKGFAWQALLAVIYLIAGVALLSNPVLGLASLTILLIAYLLADGVAEVVMGIRLRGERNWGWMVGSGVLSLVVAALLWAGFPSTATWAVGLLVGFSLFSSGIALVVMALAGREAERAATTPPSARPGGV